MGIYIKNIKMPKKCYECPCYWYDKGDGVYIHSNDGCKALGETFNEYVYYGVHIHDPFKGIYEDCPLVEIETPHGDLVDVNAAYNKIAEATAEGGYYTDMDGVGLGLEDTSVIIEGED
jgi:hypothetical protein